MKILFISHEASLTGAPKVLLQFMRWLKANEPEIELLILLERRGPVEQEFRALGETYVWHQPLGWLSKVSHKLITSSKKQQLNKHQRQIIRSVRKKKVDLVYGNTVLVAPMIEALRLSVPSILHVHELKYNVEQYGRSPALKPVLEQADLIITVSQLVYNYFHKEQKINKDRLRLVHEFTASSSVSAVQKDVLQQLPKDAFIVGGCGTINWRKGTDLFVQVAHRVLSEDKDQAIYFVWLGGNLKHSNYYEIQHDIDKLGWTDRILFVGSHSNPQDYFARFDLFLMTSREDPFPLVCLENAQLGNPIICFNGAVGSTEFITETNGAIVPYLDTEAMANAVIDFWEEPDKLEKAQKEIQVAVADYTVEQMAPKLLDCIKELVR